MKIKTSNLIQCVFAPILFSFFSFNASKHFFGQLNERNGGPKRVATAAAALMRVRSVRGCSVQPSQLPMPRRRRLVAAWQQSQDAG
jgi:hypothetical protein